MNCWDLYGVWISCGRYMIDIDIWWDVGVLCDYEGLFVCVKGWWDFVVGVGCLKVFRDELGSDLVVLLRVGVFLCV